MTRQLTCTIPVGCIPEKITRPVRVEYRLQHVRRQLDAESQDEIILFTQPLFAFSSHGCLELGLVNTVNMLAP